jgi:YjjG family noncanonical pyrimidine nucleotidase
MITTIFLDLDDTLLDFSASERSALETIFRNLDMEPSQALFDHYHRVNRSLWQELDEGRCKSKDIYEKRWEIILRQFGKTNDPRKISEAYLRELAGLAIWIPGAKAFLEEISAAFAIVIITNGNSLAARKRIAASGINDHITGIVVSEEVGKAKPDPAIFAAAMDRAGLSAPAKALMIGDNFHADIRGAQGFGISGCWFNPAGKRMPENYADAGNARDYSEVLAWIEKKCLASPAIGVLNERRETVRTTTPAENLCRHPDAFKRSAHRLPLRSMLEPRS